MQCDDKIEQLRQAIKQQGELISTYNNINDTEKLTIAVRNLRVKQKELAELTSSTAPKKLNIDRAKFEDFLKRRFFYVPSGEIYGGVAGLYDLGPMGAALEANLIKLWREQFIVQEQMHEVRCCQLTPFPILKASGHVDKFSDLMVTDRLTGECFRADHLIKNFLEKILVTEKDNKQAELDLNTLDNLGKEGIDELIQKYQIKSPTTNNEVSNAVHFNLMFDTKIGPTGTMQGFLRPETAQGIFVNFKRLLEFNNNKLPMACAQIGCSFRNEISPRSGLLRVREFLMAEIEHFVDPEDKNHAKFSNKAISDLECAFLSAKRQLQGHNTPIVMCMFQALMYDEENEETLLNNTTLAYYLAKVQLFMLSIGIKKEFIRFRQHLPNEMAHYANNCWDVELFTSYGWIECVGCADRGCFDLVQHSRASGESLVYRKELKSSVVVERTKIQPNFKAVGAAHGKKAKLVNEYLVGLGEKISAADEFLTKIDKENIKININDEEFVLTKEMIAGTKKEKIEQFVKTVEPHVIEPSFGIGRIMYALLEQNFVDDANSENSTSVGAVSRTRVQFNYDMAPIKVCVLPLQKKIELEELTRSVENLLLTNSITCKVEDSATSIGRRYARTDEIGIPLAITIDFESLSSDTVTLRDRDSESQVRVKVSSLIETVNSLLSGRATFQSLIDRLGKFN